MLPGWQQVVARLITRAAVWYPRSGVVVLLRATAASLQPSGAAVTVRHGTPRSSAGSGHWQIGLVLACATPLAQEGTGCPHTTL